MGKGVKPEGRAKKVASRTSRRSTTYPCYLPVLGEFGGSWPCRLADTKVRNISYNTNFSHKKDGLQGDPNGYPQEARQLGKKIFSCRSPFAAVPDTMFLKRQAGRNFNGNIICPCARHCAHAFLAYSISLNKIASYR